MEEVYTVKVKAQPDAARLYPSERRYSASTVGGLGAVHLALAATCILLAGLEMAQSSADWTSRYGGGAWLGIAAGLAGLTGILAWRRWYIDNNIRWFFICSCIAGITAVLCLVVTAAALAATQEEWTTTRMQILSSLKEQHLPLPVVEPVYSVSQNPEDFEVQRSLRNAEISANSKDSTYLMSNNQHTSSINSRNKAFDEIQPNDNVKLHEGVSLKNGRDHSIHPDILLSSVPKTSNEDFNGHPKSSPQLEVHDTNSKIAPQEVSKILSSSLEGKVQTETSNPSFDQQASESHHISTRQTLDENQFVDEKFEEGRVGNSDDDHHVLTGESTHQPSFNSEHIFQDGQTLYLHRNHDDASIEDDVKINDSDTGIPNTDPLFDRSVFHKHLLTNRGGETRFVIVINLLVASVLEIAWSILSAKIAWKGMKSGYPDDGPPRTNTLQRNQHDEYSKDKNKIRNKKMGGFRKPDIISNHDGVNQEYGKKPCYKEERKYPSLPLQESPTEYQERVRRFLASNSLATIDGGVD